MWGYLVERVLVAKMGVVGALSTNGSGFCQRVLGLAVPVVVRGLLDTTIGSTSMVVLGCIKRSTVSTISLTTGCSGVLFVMCCKLNANTSLLYTRCFKGGGVRTVRTVRKVTLHFSVVVSKVMTLVTFATPRLVVGVFASSRRLVSVNSSCLEVVKVACLY